MGGQFGDVVGLDCFTQLTVEHDALLAHLFNLVQQPLQLFDARLIFARFQHLSKKSKELLQLLFKNESVR